MPDREPSSSERRVLLSLWNRRERKARVATVEEMKVAELELAREPWVDPAAAIESLRGRGLVEGRGDAWTLTPTGVKAARAASRKAMAEGFGCGLVRDAKSTVYAEFCRRVYGVEHFQFNMVDAAQLDRLVEILALRPGDRFADLGCAVGALTAEIARRTGAHGTGLDFAAPAVEYARTRTAGIEGLSFVVGDMNDLDLPPASFDAVIAIDTLYFVDDLTKVVGKALALCRPGGRFAAFYSCQREEDEPAETITLEGSRLAKALRAHAGSFEAVDYTAVARGHWERASEATAALKGAWAEAGELNIWRERDHENRHVLPYYRSGRGARYLYHAVKR